MALTAVSPEKQKSPRRRRSPVAWVTDTLLAKARAYRRPNAAPVDRDWLERAFAAAKPPPGVVPAGRKLIAQDEAIGDSFGWATSFGGIISASYAEGLIWPGYTELSLLAQRAENRVISEEIAAEMTREWITLKSASNQDKTETIKKINDGLSEIKAQFVLQKAVEHDGLYGSAKIYLDCCDPEDGEELRQSIGDGRGALSKLKVNTDNPLKAIRTVEPVWVYPTNYNSVNPLRADWYKPETWFVMGREVHRTRLLTLTGREVPDILKPAYSFGGLSMTQMAKPYVDNWLRTRQSVSDLIHSFTVFALSTDMGVATQFGGEQVFKRLDLFNTFRDNAGVMVLNNKTEEEFQNVSAPLGTLDALQAQSQEHMAAISRIPIVKLLGIQPAGLNASSEGELRSFYDWIHAFQESLLRDPITTILCFVQLSLFGEVDKDITFDFNPLYQLDEKEKVEVDMRKAQTDEVYNGMGAVSPDEVRKRLAADKDSPYQGLDLDKTPAPQPEPDLFGAGGMPEGPGGKPGGGPGGPPGERPPSPEPRMPPSSSLTSLPQPAKLDEAA